MQFTHTEQGFRVHQGVASMSGRAVQPGAPNDTAGTALEGARRKVLVIDDSSTIRRTAEIFLVQAGCAVMLAEDGFEALAKIGDMRPDLIFCDILMPRLDGYQVCSLIKKSARFHATPVIMLSSRDGVFDRSRGRLVGAQDHLAKPFTRDSLLRVVQACLPPAGMASAASHPGTVPA